MCSSWSQSHLFGNWLHSAALISIWNRPQQLWQHGWAKGASGCFFSPLFFLLFCQKKLKKTKTVNERLKTSSGDPTGPGRNGSVPVDGCFSIFLLRSFFFSSFLFFLLNVIARTKPSCICISKVSSFRGDTSSYEFASLLATLLCHCKFTVGFRAFRGIHSNENSFTSSSLLVNSRASQSVWMGTVVFSPTVCLSF